MSGLGVVGDGCLLRERGGLWPAFPFGAWIPVPSAPLQLASASTSTFAGFELASLPTFPRPALRFIHSSDLQSPPPAS